MALSFSNIFPCIELTIGLHVARAGFILIVLGRTHNVQGLRMHHFGFKSLQRTRWHILTDPAFDSCMDIILFLRWMINFQGAALNGVKVWRQLRRPSSFMFNPTRIFAGASERSVKALSVVDTFHIEYFQT